MSGTSGGVPEAPAARPVPGPGARAALVVSAAVLFVLAVWAGPAAAATSAHQKAYRIGVEAYTYGLPLLQTDATFRTMTSVNVSSGAYGPVNQFNNVSGLNTSGSTTVVAPGAGSLSSIAWLDLRAGPQVLTVPEVVDHFYVLALIDPYTEDLVNLGSVHDTRPGDYVICAPGQYKTPIPAGTSRLRVDATRIWIIGSTQVKGPDDIAAVNRIQAGYRLTPLSEYGTGWRPSPPAVPQTTVKRYTVPNGLAFFDRLGTLLEEFPPPGRDRAALRRFAQAGIGPGLQPSEEGLSAAVLRGLEDAAAVGPQQVAADQQQELAGSFSSHDGYLVGGFGRYGTDYRLRAVISQIGLGAMTSEQAVFAMTWVDRDGHALNGSNAYVLHLPPSLPVDEGWSLTVYSLQGSMIANSLGRFAINDSSALTRNADGSADIYLQSTEPTSTAQAANWLPTGAGQGFEVTWRLLAPVPGRIPGILDGSGWRPPAIRPAP